MRLRALVLLLRHSGLRITDAVTLSKHPMEDGGILNLHTAKTGTHVRVPLPEAAIEAIPTENYYFLVRAGNEEILHGRLPARV